MSTPSRRDRLRPVELVGLAVVIGAFTGAIVLMSTRSPLESVVWAGTAFIASLVITAMLVLATKPKSDEIADIQELDSHS